jgi:oxalate decarboxylase/phosphoglucose isomerase-like protein (cupin superfamily)
MAEVEFIDLSGEMPKDGRGFSFFPWRGRAMNPAEVLRTAHLLSILPGQTRGNHYHPGQEEWLFTFHGTGVLVWEAAGKIRERVVAPDGTLIRLPPGIAHALTNPGPEILYLLAWRQPAGEGGMEPESVPKQLR